MTAGRTPPRSGRAWIAYPLLALPAVLAYYRLPTTGAAGALRPLIYCLVSASAAVAILVGIRLWRPRPRLPWVLLAVGQAVYAAADVTYYVSRDVLDIHTFPAPSDFLHLAHYPLLVAALVLLVRLRAPGRGLPGLLDATMLAVAASMLSWLTIIGPQMAVDAPLLEKVVCVSLPAADLAVLAVSLRLVLERGRRPASFFLIVGSLVAALAADTVYVWQQVNHTYENGIVLDLVWLASNVALGAAALHPTMADLSEPGPPTPPAPGRLRIAALAAATLVAPVTLLVHAPDADRGDVVVIALACAAMFLLVILRMAGLVAEQRRLAITDGLTGLATRRFVEDRLATEIARIRRNGGALSLLLVDVDHFKLVNDRHGHQAGDRVLVEISRRLERSASGGVLARFGGEEFALLVPHAGSGTLAAIAERLREAVGSSPVAIGPDEWTSVTVSVGAAAFPEHAADAGELVGVVDGALYAAKERGRDRAVIGPAPRSPFEAAGSDDGVAGDGAGAPRRGGPADYLVYLSYVAEDVDGRLSGHEHSSAIARWARAMALELGLDADTVRRVELSGRLHDVGKVVVPEAVLTKPDRLSPEEWALMARHAEHGYRMTLGLPGLRSVAKIIRQHHERYDGTGYPYGLPGRDIRIEARLIAVCDSWAAMRADRLYQAALTEEQACAELLGGRGTQFDGDFVELFLELRERGVVGELRRLRTGPAAPQARSPRAPAAPGLPVAPGAHAAWFQDVTS